MKRSEALRYRRHISTVIENLGDAEALAVADLFIPWAVDTDYKTGERVRYADSLYQCVQAHTSQANWTPDLTPALWKRVSVEEWPEWVQPTGAQDAYMKGDKVSYNGQHWISIVDNNVWQPGVYGWETV